MRPCDFWALHPYEFYWLADGYAEKMEVERSNAGKLTEDEVLQMKDELRHARVAAGFPPE